MGLEIINKLKKEKGLTNEELSQKSGVPLGTLSKITSGITKDPKLETLKSIAKVLDCSLDDFDDTSNTNSTISKDEIILLNQYRQLSQRSKKLISTIISFELSQE
ncbi:TPA: helix-turn-helix domain-containing protein [Clostridium perfringens]